MTTFEDPGKDREKRSENFPANTREFSEKKTWFQKQNDELEEGLSRNIAIRDPRPTSLPLSKYSSTNRSLFPGSFEDKESSSDKQFFVRDGTEYERSSNQFKRESKQYPTGDDRHIVQTREYRYETKEHPVSISDRNINIIQNEGRKTAQAEAEVSDHQYENVEFSVSDKPYKSHSSKSYLNTSQEAEVAPERFRRSLFETSNSSSQRMSSTMERESSFRRNQRLLGLDPARVSVSGSAVRLVGVNESAEFSLSAPQSLKEDDLTVQIMGEFSLLAYYLFAKLFIHFGIRLSFFQ